MLCLSSDQRVNGATFGTLQGRAPLPWERIIIINIHFRLKLCSVPLALKSSLDARAVSPGTSLDLAFEEAMPALMNSLSGAQHLHADDHFPAPYSIWAARISQEQRVSEPNRSALSHKGAQPRIFATGDTPSSPAMSASGMGVCSTPGIRAALRGVLDPKGGEAMVAAGAYPPPLRDCHALALVILQRMPAGLRLVRPARLQVTRRPQTYTCFQYRPHQIPPPVAVTATCTS